MTSSASRRGQSECWWRRACSGWEWSWKDELAGREEALARGEGGLGQGREAGERPRWAESVGGTADETHAHS